MKSKVLLMIWLKTFLYSFVLSVIVGIVYLTLVLKSEDSGHVVPLLITGALFINAILFLMSMLSLFITTPVFFTNGLSRAALFFGGCVIFIISILFARPNSSDRGIYLAFSFIYLLVSIFFYLKKVRRAV